MFNGHAKVSQGSINRRTALASLAASVVAPGLALAQGADILIGQSAPLSGGMAPTMTGVLAGQQLAFDEVNKRGGLNGRPVKLVILDDGFDPKRSLENARALVEQNQAIALFGFVGTAQTAAVLPYIVEKRVPLISVYSGSPALRVKPNPYFFTTQASYADELIKMTRNLMAAAQSRIAVVYQNNDFGKLLAPLAEKIIAAEGATVVASKALDAGGADAVAVSQSLLEAKPQGIIMLVAGPAVVAFVKANKVTAGVPIYTLSLSVGTAILKALGDDARGMAISRATPYPWHPVLPLTRNFNQLMERAGKPVDYDHFVGYINGRIIIEGLRKAGKNPTAESLTQAMEKLGKLDLGGFVWNYSPQNHHGSNFVEISVVGPRGNFIR
jgi:branched-chain amino acid transport system substrate-binding protein